MDCAPLVPSREEADREAAVPASKPAISINSMDSTAVIDREVIDYRDVDIDKRKTVEGLREMKAGWEFTIDGIMAVWVLFNAVVTTMIIINTFKSTIPSDERTINGSDVGFVWLFRAVTYYPLVFFYMLVLLINNNYAERTFYEYLLRGVIVDFPESGQLGFMARRPRVLLFAVTFLLYFGFVVGVLLHYKAPFGTIAIVLNNLAVGIGLLWYRHQTIEDKFVSITTFIQSFPDADGAYDNIDAVSLAAAAEFLRELSLAECTEPSYTGLARRMFWQRHKIGFFGKLLSHVGAHGLILLLAGLCVVYFYFMDNHLEAARFALVGNPCVQACVDASNSSRCGFCVYRCAELFHLQDLHAGCAAHLSVPGCSAVRDCPN